ncbi:MAG: hypothetical protein OXN97_03150 [Bryobacterales bacterium]|nr:hypothetical protein [Bryobacterales bacterium]MDE0628375.1 hypothetical protein [Bryobacterales bacterium]
MILNTTSIPSKVTAEKMLELPVVKRRIGIWITRAGGKPGGAGAPH